MTGKIRAGDGLKKVQFKAGQLLFREGDQSRYFFILTQGQVEVFKTGDNNKEIPLAILGSGQSLGEFAMIDNSPRSASARCLTDVEAVMVNEDAYRYMLQKLPDWAISMMQGLIMRIRETNEILKRHGIIDEALSQKIASLEFDEEITKTLNIDLDDVDNLNKDSK